MEPIKIGKKAEKNAEMQDELNERLFATQMNEADITKLRQDNIEKDKMVKEIESRIERLQDELDQCLSLFEKFPAPELKVQMFSNLNTTLPRLKKVIERVENLINKIIYFCIKGHRYLTDMYNFCCSSSDNMYPQNFKSLNVEQDFKHTRIITHDLISCDLIIIGAPYFITKAKLFELLFSIAARRNFWNRINTDRIKCR